MSATTTAPATTLAHAARRWLGGWWHALHLAALLGAMALSPSSYRGPRRRMLLQQLVADAAPALPGFTVLTALVSLVLIRIVLVTASSYGLSQYALEMVVRVLVLELIPLSVALYTALRCAIPNATEIAQMRADGAWQRSADPLREHVLPRVLAGVFCALLLAALNCVVTLVLSYLSVYGFTTAGLEGYARTVGNIFEPAVSLIFALKVLLLGGAVALMPIAAILDQRPSRRTSAEVQGLVRMFLVILLIEAASLAGNYV